MGGRKHETSTDGVDPHLLAFDCITCGRPVRKRGVKGSEAPGTMAYGRQGECKSCTQLNTLAAVIPADLRGDAGVDSTVSSLRRWLNARYARGVQSESADPIKWGNTPHTR